MLVLVRMFVIEARGFDSAHPEEVAITTTQAKRVANLT